MKRFFDTRVLALILTVVASVVGSESVCAQPSLFQLTTFTNPTPANNDLFADSVAALGDDRVLVGADGAGAAYLLGLNGALLATYTNPAPSLDGFGYSIAGVGSDHVLIGAYNFTVGPMQIGKAFLFDTNNTLLTTFTNPNPAVVQAFGWSVAGVGSSRVIIGATASSNAYMFNTNGSLASTFANPRVSTNDGFGIAVAALGNDRVIIGAPYDETGASAAGVAYLFSTNGTLLTTVTNPTPAISDYFGWAVTAVGSNCVVVGAFQDRVGTTRTGAAYMFNTNGTLITTFTNPTPAASDSFGWSLSAVGTARVLIGAFQDSTGEARAGAAYLFSTNGTLITTFTNPTPALSDWFGVSVASVGSGRVLIGAVWDDTGATDSGSAYLYSLPVPPLGISQDANTVSVSWITAETGLILQQTSQLGTPAVWTDTADTITITGLTNVVQPTNVSNSTRFYRLRRP